MFLYQRKKDHRRAVATDSREKGDQSTNPDMAVKIAFFMAITLSCFCFSVAKDKRVDPGPYDTTIVPTICSSEHFNYSSPYTGALGTMLYQLVLLTPYQDLIFTYQEGTMKQQHMGMQRAMEYARRRPASSTWKLPLEVYMNGVVFVLEGKFSL